MEGNIIKSALRKLFTYCRRIKNKRLAKKQLDYNISLFCNNCVGAMVLHDYGMPFNSPCVNLWIEPAHYVEMLSNLEYYMSADIRELKQEDVNYPIGLLDGKIKIYFMHYDSFEQAVSAWRRRAQRVNYNKVHAIFVYMPECKLEDAENFLQLPEHIKKTLIAPPAFPLKHESIRFIHDCEINGHLGNTTEVSDLSGHRYYNQINWLKELS